MTALWLMLLPAQALAASVPAATIKDGVPVGLYFMTRFSASSGSLEKAVWYFTKEGTVYERLATGVSDADLAAHTGRKGQAAAAADRLNVTWSDGKSTSSKFSRSGKGFSWNGGIFTPVKPIDPSKLVGNYEGGESLSGSSGRAIVSKRLNLAPDGTFSWTGVSFLSSTGSNTRVTATSTGGGAAGTWKASDYSLTLKDQSGTVFQRICFPYDDESTPTNPDHLFFGGLLYKKGGGS